MEDALRRVIGEKIAAEGEAKRLRAERDEWKPALQEKVRDFHEMMDWMGTTCKGHEDMGTFQFIASLVYDRYYLRSIYDASARISDIRLARMAELEVEAERLRKLLGNAVPATVTTGALAGTEAKE
jgi:hypothetical protein